MYVTPISFKQNTVYSYYNQKPDGTNSDKNVDLPSQVDAKSYVNVNFRAANTKAFDTFIKRVSPRHKYNAASLEEVPSLRASGVAEQLKELVTGPLEYYKYFKRVIDNVGFPKGLIFSDKPGTGKTVAAELLAVENNIPLYKINLCEVVSFNPKESKYESKDNIKKIFEQLKQKFEETGEPSILHIEDADSLIREFEEENITNYFLDLLSKSEEMGIIPVIETTSKIPYLTKLLPKFHNINFTYPNVDGRKMIIKEALKQQMGAEALSKDKEAIKEIAEKTENMSPAMLNQLINDASYNAWEKHANITKNDLLNALYNRKYY